MMTAGSRFFDTAGKWNRMVVLFILLGMYGPTVSAQSEPDWVRRSNRYTMRVLETLAKHAPEYAASLGVEGYDEEILDLTPGFNDRSLTDLKAVQSYLDSLIAIEKEETVMQDLKILINDVSDEIEGLQLDQKYMLPYYNVAGYVYYGLRSLLEERIPPERRKSAAVRLKKYAGNEPGHEPFAWLVINHMEEEWRNSDRMPPFREELERNLSTSDQYMDEIGILFEKYQIGGYEADLELLTQQIADYNTYIREKILPLSREDFQLPREIYTFRLREFGVDMPLDQLVRRAMVSFKELQDQMQVLAGQIAEQRGYSSGDYRDVIRNLKKAQLDSTTILSYYQGVIRDLENIIVDHEIVTIPDRSMVVRLATPAESAASPAPFMSPPRLIGNTGEYGEFVLPIKVTGGSEGSSLKVDDFMHEAASWALAAHEGRPGHELQFTSIVERGVSQARIIFARNSVNVEGWALYMEEQVLPYVPLEGQFMILWSRLVRSGRAFLDPGLNTGTLTTDEARYILEREIVLSEALVRSELERYRFRAPGQATSYLNGYLRMMELRMETELKLGDTFNQLEYHDFILSQGLLPPSLIRDAVLNEFMPRYRAAAFP